MYMHVLYMFACMCEYMCDGEYTHVYVCMETSHSYLISPIIVFHFKLSLLLNPELIDAQSSSFPHKSLISTLVLGLLVTLMPAQSLPEYCVCI